MLGYAWRCLTGRSTVWIAALGCAGLVALPGLLAATVFAVPAVSLAVTGDPALAISLLPESLTGADSILLWVLVAAATALVVGLYTRLYATGVWASNESNESSVRAAWRESKRSWGSVSLLYIQGYGLLLIAALGFAPILAASSGGGGSAPSVLFVIAVLLVARTLMRVVLTTAVRAAVLDELSTNNSWRKAIAVISNRRPDATAAWATLLGIGVAVWVGGRLISPVLQDTAFAYPAQSAYSYLREVAQLLLAIPLEGFLVALSLGVWTALYLDVQPEVPAPDAQPRRRLFAPADPWLTRALALLVVVVVVVNGIPTAVDRAFAESNRDEVAAITEQEVSIGELLDSPPAGADRRRTRYRVDADLDNGVLSWTTVVDYRNETGEQLTTVGLNVYPAAFSRPVEEIPLAPDLLATDLSGEFTSTAAPGSLDVVGVSVDGRDAGHELDDTALTIDLSRSIEPGTRTEISIELQSELPRFPERFGVWEEITLLGNWIPALARRDGGDWRFDTYGAVGDPFVSEVADYEVVIEADDGSWIAGTGALTRIEASAPQRRRWHFRATSARDAAFAVSPFMRALQGDAAGVTVRSWYPAEERIRGRANLATALSIVRFYTETFGPLPFDEIEVVATQGLLGGMEYPGVVFVSDTGNALQGLPLLPDLLRYAGFAEAQRRYVLAHEIAHQWWYAAVGSDQVREPWLDEALAEMSTILWLRHADGDQRAWRMTNLRSGASAESASISARVNDFSSNRTYTDVVYLSGSALLMELRERVGEQRFLQILRSYFEKFEGDLATISDFIDVVESIGGRSAAEMLQRHR